MKINFSDKFRSVKNLILTTALLATPALASACPVCIGNQDDPMTKGLSTGILFMLGILIMVFGGFAGFVFIVAKRRPQVTSKDSLLDQVATEKNSKS